MKRTIACVIGIVLLCQSTLLAELRVANIFNDNMVLQQEKPIRVWGWADSAIRGTALKERFRATQRNSTSKTSGNRSDAVQ